MWNLPAAATGLKGAASRKLQRVGEETFTRRKHRSLTSVCQSMPPVNCIQISGPNGYLLQSLKTSSDMALLFWNSRGLLPVNALPARNLASAIAAGIHDTGRLFVPYLLSMIDSSFMSRANSIVIPGGKLDIAMQLILTPIILQLLEKKRRAL